MGNSGERKHEGRKEVDQGNCYREKVAGRKSGQQLSSLSNVLDQIHALTSDRGLQAVKGSVKRTLEEQAARVGGRSLRKISRRDEVRFLPKKSAVRRGIEGKPAQEGCQEEKKEKKNEIGHQQAKSWENPRNPTS